MHFLSGSRQKDDPHVAHQISRHHFRTNASFAHHRRCARHAHCALFRRDGGNRRLLCGLQASQYAAAPFCGRGLPAGIRADALRGEGKGARGRRKALHRQCLYGARACRLHRERPRRHRGAASRLGDCGRHEGRPGSLHACDGAHAIHVPLHRIHEPRCSCCGSTQHPEEVCASRCNADSPQYFLHYRDRFSRRPLLRTRLGACRRRDRRGRAAARRSGLGTLENRRPRASEKRKEGANG